jgi:signal transduction histidine kinase
MDELKIDDEDRTDFLNHLIVEDDDKQMLVQRLKDSDLVLTMGGPFPGSNLEFQVLLFFWGLFIIALIVPSLAWAIFINRDIKKIETGSSLFAAGDYTARVKVSKISSMVQIASAFNHMAEKVQNVLESQKEIANSVSHEIRTPLARIKFSMEMLNDAIRTEPGDKNYLREIGRDVKEIESLVDEMLTYARFGRDREASETLTKQEIISWLNAIVDAQKKGFPERQIRFVCNPEDSTYRVLFEPVYLGWAVSNLVRNAACYADALVEVSVEFKEDMFCIHVDDDGPGIADELKEKIFEPFFRQDKSRNRTSGGYGFGLAISKRIALWHKGGIGVSASPYGGSRFTIRLPY